MAAEIYPATVPELTPNSGYGMQLFRRVSAAGLGGFVLVASPLHAAVPAEASTVVTPHVYEAAPNQQVTLAVPVGGPTLVSPANSPILSNVEVDHAPHVDIDLSNMTIETLIAPSARTSKAAPMTNVPSQAKPVSTQRERIVPVSKDQLKLFDDKNILKNMAPPAAVKELIPAVKWPDTTPAPAVAAVAPSPAPSTPARRPARELHISNDGISMVASFEGWSGDEYNDATGNATIGYGHLIHSGPINGSEPTEFRRGITEERGRELLRADLAIAEQAVDDAVTVPLTQEEEDALDSFAFNVGGGAFRSSTLLRRLNEGQYDAVPEELSRWDQGNGRTLAGLTRRRTKEAEVWNTGKPEANVPAQPEPASPITLPPVDLATRRPIEALDQALSGLVPPHALGKVINLMASPHWRVGNNARTETSNQPYLRLPFNGPAIVTSEFGHRESPTEGASTCHLGVDFALDTGDPILAPRDGTVVANASLPGNGNMIGVMHGDVVTWYFHLNSKSPVAVGTRVTTGQVIGEAGSTGVSNGPHLHFAIQVGVDPSRPVSLQDNVNGHYVDPTGFLDGSIKDGNQFNTLRTAVAC